MGVEEYDLFFVTKASTVEYSPFHGFRGKGMWMRTEMWKEEDETGGCYTRSLLMDFQTWYLTEFLYFGAFS